MDTQQNKLKANIIGFQALPFFVARRHIWLENFQDDFKCLHFLFSALRPPGGSDGKELACNVGDPGSIHAGSGRSPDMGDLWVNVT